MTGIIDSLERDQLRKVPHFEAGDRVKVHFQVVEGTRRRTQIFEGTVIKRQGVGARETFTVRKQSFGVGVERTFPVHSPKVEQIEIASRGDVRRAKLYYLRGRVGRRARVRERRYTGAEEERRTGIGAPGGDEAFGAQDAQGAQDDAELLEAEGPTDAEGAQEDAEVLEAAAPEEAEEGSGEKADADAEPPEASTEEEPAEDAPAEPVEEEPAEEPAAAEGEEPPGSSS